VGHVWAASWNALREGSGGRFDLPTGTIYPALHRLERAELIVGSCSTVDGRRPPHPPPH
jgi:DNA-binding PadR family transcriptional regulator